MSPELNNVFQDVIKIINHMKVLAVNSRLFTQLCEEMDTEHTRLLSLTEVRGFLTVHPWPEFLSYGSHSRDFL